MKLENSIIDQYSIIQKLDMTIVNWKFSFHD